MNCFCHNKAVRISSLLASKLRFLVACCCLLSGAMSVFPLYAAEGIIPIDERYLNVDAKQKIILVNQSTTELNALCPGAKQSLVCGEKTYTFDAAVQCLETGQAYVVTDNEQILYDFYCTMLPVIRIETKNTIRDEPRVPAIFYLCTKEGNIVQDTIGVEYRGGTTQSYPKKSLRIEFWADSEGKSTKDYSLLGMRNDDDWNLQAMYNEPLRIRSKLCFELWQSMSALYYAQEEPEALNGVRQEYVELFLNNEYRGVYTLSERVDRKQLKLKKYKNGSIRGELYKGVSWGASTFTSLPAYDNKKILWGGLEYKYPDPDAYFDSDESPESHENSDSDDNSDPEKLIDWANIYDFVRFVLQEQSAGFYEGIPAVFDQANAVDYFIFLNLIRARDNCGKNIYIARYDSDEPYFYLPWDLDGSLGMKWDGTRRPLTHGLIGNGLFNRLISPHENNNFPLKLQERWAELRSEQLTHERIMQMFREQFDYLDNNGVYQRELKVWNKSLAVDYDNLHYTADWLEKRLAWLDDVFDDPEKLSSLQTTDASIQQQLCINLRPSTFLLEYQLFSDHYLIEDISLMNMAGCIFLKSPVAATKGLMDISPLPPGLYLAVFTLSDGSVQVKKLIR